MATNAFDDFVQREQGHVIVQEDAPFDLKKEMADWEGHLKSLYAQVTEYLDGYVKAGQVAISHRSIRLNEEQTGDYFVQEMTIAIGAKKIVLEPIGTFLIGSRGRVDVVGPFARAQLVLLDSNVKSASDMFRITVNINGRAPSPPPPSAPRKIDWVWRLITRPPQRAIVELNKQNFLDLLLEIANG